jgi:excisionase family DNA binding protein
MKGEWTWLWTNIRKKQKYLCGKKYTISIEEAAEYFHIGQTRLRRLIADNPDADFILMIGNRIQIKRELFEDYIDAATAV